MQNMLLVTSTSLCQKCNCILYDLMFQICTNACARVYWVLILCLVTNIENSVLNLCDFSGMYGRK